MNTKLKFDLTGQRFGRWSVIGRTDARRLRDTAWVCLCECGTERLVKSTALRSGTSKSCGCIQKASYDKRTRTHRSWISMRLRCFGKNQKSYKNYGGRGITVCERWDDYLNFLSDMGERPLGTTLDRINGEGNYEPGNCRWATPRAQANNMRVNHVIEWRGRSQTLTQWARELNISWGTLNARIRKHRWPVERAFTESLRKITPRRRVLGEEVMR